MGAVGGNSDDEKDSQHPNGKDRHPNHNKQNTSISEMDINFSQTPGNPYSNDTIPNDQHNNTIVDLNKTASNDVTIPGGFRVSPSSLQCE